MYLQHLFTFFQNSLLLITEFFLRFLQILMSVILEWQTAIKMPYVKIRPVPSVVLVRMVILETEQYVKVKLQVT